MKMIWSAVEVLVFILFAALIVVLIIALAAGAVVLLVALRVLRRIHRIAGWKIQPKPEKGKPRRR